jgi:hypothetical protein
MRTLPWQKIIFFLLILVILFGISGCQSNIAKDLDNFFHSFAHAPDHLARVVTNLMGGLSNIGDALADQVKNIVQGMTGR